MASKRTYAVVTGGGAGIGAAVTRELGKRGDHVFIIGRKHGDLLEFQAELERTRLHVHAVPGDLSDAASAKRILDAIEAKTDHVDCLVNNAGVYLLDAIEDMKVRDWDATFNVNVKGLFLFTRMLLPLMKGKGGAIVNIASTVAWRSSPGSAAYAASKAAVVSLTRSMAREFGPMNIRANCVCPGIVDTNVHDRRFGDRKAKEAFFKRISAEIPAGRIGTADDVARAVVFLLSDDASWITGSVLAVDGGMSVL
jgi:meso-butanediol dehydrogenase/(S,S)-butanediol dehydrogenase/diacetyl reductase